MGRSANAPRETRLFLSFACERSRARKKIGIGQPTSIPIFIARTHACENCRRGGCLVSRPRPSCWPVRRTFQKFSRRGPISPPWAYFSARWPRGKAAGLLGSPGLACEGDDPGAGSIPARARFNNTHLPDYVNSFRNRAVRFPETGPNRESRGNQANPGNSCPQLAS